MLPGTDRYYQRLHEGLLRRVLGVFAITSNLQGGEIRLPHVGLYQSGKRCLVNCLGVLHEPEHFSRLCVFRVSSVNGHIAYLLETPITFHRLTAHPLSNVVWV